MQSVQTFLKRSEKKEKKITAGRKNKRCVDWTGGQNETVTGGKNNLKGYSKNSMQG